LIQFEQITNEIKVPRTSSRTLYSRLYLRDGQSCVVSGLFDDSVTKSIRKFPFLADIPVFGWLFTNPSSTNDKSEILFVYTPTVMRTSGQKVAALVPRPGLPETETYLKQVGLNGQKVSKLPYDAGKSDAKPGSEVVTPETPMPASATVETKASSATVRPSSATVESSSDEVALPLKSKPEIEQRKGTVEKPQKIKAETKPAPVSETKATTSAPLPELPLSTGSGESFYPPVVQDSSGVTKPAPANFPPSNPKKNGLTSDLKLRREDTNTDTTSGTSSSQSPAQPAVDTMPPAAILPVPPPSSTGPLTAP
jgi:type II secretory pathway component HofQ